MKKKFLSFMTIFCMIIGIIPAQNGIASSDIVEILNEVFDYTLDSKLSAQNGWTVNNESSEGGSTLYIKSNPEDNDDNVLDIEVLATKDTEKDRYATLSAEKSIEGKRYIVFNEQIRITSDQNRFIFYPNVRWRKTTDTTATQKMDLIQITFDPKNNKITNSCAGSAVDVSAEFPVDEWIDMKFVIDTQNQSYDIYMNNTKLNTDSLATTTNVGEEYYLAEFVSLRVGANRYDGTLGHIYIDDMVIYAFDNEEYIDLDLRLAKMHNGLTASVLTGQTNATEDFTPNIPYLEADDVVDIACTDGAFVYDAVENKVVITQGDSDKTVTVDVTVTSVDGKTFTKEIEVFIPKITILEPEADEPENPGVARLLFERFNGYIENTSISGQGNWSMENENLVGNTAFVKADPSPAAYDDKVLDIEVVTNNDSSANRYVKLSIDKNIDKKKYLMFDEKVRFTEGIISSVFYANCKLTKNSSTEQNQELIQLTYDLRNSQFIHSIDGGSEVIAENITFPLNEWIDMKFVVDVEEQKYHLYMNDVKINEEPVQIYKPLDGYTITDINNIRVGSIRHNNTAGHIYIDDIKISAFDNPDDAGLELRMEKMKAGLTSSIFTGQTNVTKDFTPSIPYIETDDTVNIDCTDSAFVYNSEENKVTVTQGSEDKTVTVNITVTSATGKTMTKSFEILIPKVFTDDFNLSGFEQLPLSGQYSVNTDYHINVSTGENSISMISDNLCYFSADDFDEEKFVDDIPRKEAGHSVYPMAPSYGLNYQFVDSVIKPIEETDVTAEKASDTNKPLFDEYSFVGPNASATYFAGEVEGKKAIGQFTYIRSDRYQTSQNAKQTNEVKFEIDNGIFTTKDNNLTIEIEYYTDDDGEYTVYYPGLNNSQKQFVFGGNGSHLTKGEWTVAKFNVTDADFSHYLENGQGNSLRINANASGKTIFYHKIAIYPTPDTTEYVVGKSAEIAFSDFPLTSETRVSFNMLLPEDKVINNEYTCNGVGSQAALSVISYDGKEIATIVWSIETQKDVIYALHGNDEKSIIYEGEVTGKSLLYKIDVSPETNTYRVIVEDNGNIIGVLQGLDILDIDLYTDKCNVAKIQLSHGATSYAVCTEITDAAIYSKIDEDAKKCGSELQALTIEKTNVISDFELPSVGSIYPEDVTIAWFAEEEQSYLIVEDGIARVFPDANEHSVKLTATISCGNSSLNKVFDIKICSVEGMYTEIGEVVYSTQNGSVSATVSLKNAGTSGSYGESFEPFDITFAAVSYNPLTGEITDRKKDTQEVTSKYSQLDFEISGLTKNPNDEIAYYLWDENDVPIVNNAPTEIKNVTAENKLRSVNISWEESYDDHNALMHYAIYRDGELIDVCKNTPENGKVSYRDGSAALLDKAEHTYKVMAVDTNDFKSELSESVSGHTSDMPYKFEVRGLSEANFTANGVNIVTGKTPVNEAYFEFTTIGGSPCIYTPFPTGTSKSYYTPTFKSDKSKLDSSCKKVVAEVTYFDKGTGNIQCVYWSASGRKICENAVALKNTNQWKVAVFTMDDALFEESTSFSGGDFGFYSTSTSLYIKKVEIARAEDY